MESKTPVFDIGDTISPSIPLARREVENFLEERGVGAPEFPAREVDQYSVESIRNWLEKEELKVDAEELTEKIKQRKEEELEKAGTFELLRRLGEDRKPGIISDNSIKAKEFHRGLFDRHGVEIDGFVVSEEVGEKKPSKKIFQEFLDRRDVEGDECVYFGNDVRKDPAAEKVGMKFVLVEQFTVFGDGWDGDTIQELSYREVKKRI